MKPPPFVLLLGVLVILIAAGTPTLHAAPAAGRIVVDVEPSAFEEYAAKELQRYLYQLSGSWLEIGPDWETKEPCFIIGRAERLAAMKPAGVEPWVAVAPDDSGPQGYVLKKLSRLEQEVIVSNYDGEAGHNEMFHNFEVGGTRSRVWMPTVRTGHRWSCPGWDVAAYRFGASDLFDDYDFGQQARVCEVRVASDLSTGKGGIIELRLDGPYGKVLGSAKVTQTGGWQTWTSGRRQCVSRFPEKGQPTPE